MFGLRLGLHSTGGVCVWLEIGHMVLVEFEVEIESRELVEFVFGWRLGCVVLVGATFGWRLGRERWLGIRLLEVGLRGDWVAWAGKVCV